MTGQEAMADPWRPLSVREGIADAGDYESLHDGLPPWLRRSVADWVADVLHWRPGEKGFARAAEGIARRLRLRIDVDPDEPISGAMVDLVRRDQPRALDVVDAVLQDEHTKTPGRQLSKLLSEGGSAWTVGETADGRRCLQRRVTGPVADRYVEVTKTADAPAVAELRKAWNALYGREPSPSAAIDAAVAAVVEAVRDSTDLTAGSLSGLMDELASRRVVVVGRSDDGAVVGMIRLLASSSSTRAKRSQAAEVAVHLAVTLVHLFTAGLASIRAR